MRNRDAFGTPYLSNLDNGMSFGYTGKIFDSDTGLYDYGFRDYSPNSARFTTVDPVRDGANWFSYVVNDPVNYIDPFGLTPSDAGNGNSPKITFTSDIIQQTYIGDTQFNFSIDVSQLGAEPSQNVTFSLVTSKPSFEFTLPTITPESFSQSSTNSDWALTQEEFDNIIANSNTNSSGWDYDSVMRAIARGETPRPSVDNRIKDGSKSWLPMEGPCLMRALMGIAETYAGKNLTEEQLKSIITDLMDNNKVESQDIPEEDRQRWTVYDSEAIIRTTMQNLGVDTSNMSIKESRPKYTNYETVKANAFASIRGVTRADKPNSGKVGHYQEGDKNGNLVFDPISGSSDGGRVLVETRYFQLIINE